MDLYYCSLSPPCRAVLMTAKAVGVEPNKIELDLRAGDHMKEEFVALNPQHCVPTIVDDDLTLYESRAICQYLVNQYGGDDSLYPADPKTRAKMDRLINFDMGTLFDRFAHYVRPVLKRGEAPDSDALAKVHEALGWLNDALSNGDYAVGDSLTIADFILVATVSTMSECDIDLGDYEHVAAWLERCKENIPDYEEVNGAGATQFGEYFKSKVNQEE